MDLLKELVDLLQKGGPWTFTAISLLVSFHLYRELRTAQKEAAKDKQDLNDRLIKTTEKQTEVLTINNENQRLLIEAIKNSED